MAKFTSFEDIHAWQKSRKLIREIRYICKRENVCRDFAFIDQITKASRSISYNIAEGFESGSNKEFARFLRYSRRSAAEVRAQLYDALDEEYISKQEFLDLKLQITEIGKMLTRLIQYLHNQTKKPSNYHTISTIETI